MSEVTVRTLAKLVGTPVEKLLEQLSEAGMTFDGPDQVVTPTEKMKLLGFLRRTHGKAEPEQDDSTPKQITLKRRKVQGDHDREQGHSNMIAAHPAMVRAGGP